MTAKPDTSFGIKVSKKDFTKPNGAINSKWIVKNLQILFDNNAIINLTGHRVLEITDANISETQKLEGATANFIRYSAKRVSDEYSIPGASVGDVVHGLCLLSKRTRVHCGQGVDTHSMDHILIIWFLKMLRCLE